MARKQVYGLLVRHGDYDRMPGDGTVWAHEGPLNHAGTGQIATSSAILENYNVVKWGCSPSQRAFDSLCVARNELGFKLPERFFYPQLVPVNQQFFARFNAARKASGASGEATLEEMWNFDPEAMSAEGDNIRGFLEYMLRPLEDGQAFAAFSHEPIISFGAMKEGPLAGQKMMGKGDVMVFDCEFEGDELVSTIAANLAVRP